MGLSTVIKTSNQSTTSTTLVADNDLNFSISGNTLYNIQSVIYGTVTGVLVTYTWSISIPSSPTRAIINSRSLILGAASLNLGGGSTFPYTGTITGVTNTSFQLEINLLIQNVNAGLITFSFATSAGGTVSTLGGSLMILGT